MDFHTHFPEYMMELIVLSVYMFIQGFQAHLELR